MRIAMRLNPRKSRRSVDGLVRRRVRRVVKKRALLEVVLQYDFGA
jgi:hypothetical protein